MTFEVNVIVKLAVFPILYLRLRLLLTILSPMIPSKELPPL